MQISVIIPTYNRVKDLDECLDSIIIQTQLPKEVIIVDDSDNNEIENLIQHRKGEFKEKNIILRYIRNERERSLTVARNIGVENATKAIILFLDSDVILDKDYIKEILKVYKEKPDAIGIQGLIQIEKDRGPLFKFLDIFNRLFYLSFNEKNRCRVLPSLNSTYPYSLDKIINCEWLSGSNQSYKKLVLEKFKYDENLKKYSYNEDVDLSYRIFKKYPDSLFMTPYAKLIHKTSQEGRHLKKELIYMKIIYQNYLFYKNIDQNPRNKLIYLGSRIVRNMLDIVFSIVKLRVIEIKYIFKANFFSLKHLKETKAGNLKFFNKGLTK